MKPFTLLFPLLVTATSFAVTPTDSIQSISTNSEPHQVSDTVPTSLNTISEATVDSAKATLKAAAARDSLLHDSAHVAATLLAEPIAVVTPKMQKFTISGLLRGTAYAKDFAAGSDANKSVSLGLDLARLLFKGEYPNGYGFSSEVDLVKGANGIGLGQVFMYWKPDGFRQVKAGRIKRAFSHEALLSDAQLPFNYRGRLYQTFLRTVTGYSGYDLGLSLASGFEDEGIPVRYELGVYNGRSSTDPKKGYGDDAFKDTDLKAKDLSFRLEVMPWPCLTAEAAVSTRSTDDKSDKDNWTYNVNTAYEAGLFYSYAGWGVNGEFAYGDNQQGEDLKIISGSSKFFACYLEGVKRHTYGKTGKWSEAILKVEALDPDMAFGSADGRPNDGKLRYSLGVTYGLTPDISLSGSYGVLHPLTDSEASSDYRLQHDLDLFWRMTF